MTKRPGQIQDCIKQSEAVLGSRHFYLVKMTPNTRTASLLLCKSDKTGHAKQLHVLQMCFVPITMKRTNSWTSYSDSFARRVRQELGSTVHNQMRSPFAMKAFSSLLCLCQLDRLRDDLNETSLQLLNATLRVLCIRVQQLMRMLSMIGSQKGLNCLRQNMPTLPSR